MSRTKLSWLGSRKGSARSGQTKRTVFAGMVLMALPGFAAAADIIWSGDFETGNFLQWHITHDTATPFYAGIPQYGRPKAPSPLSGSKPTSYYGDGSLVQLVTSPVRQGRYAAKITVKNSANGREPYDCDSGGTECQRRRTELQMHRALSDHYNAMPYMSERWISASYFVPSDWDSVNGRGKMLHVMQVKPRNDGQAIGPALSVQLLNDGWHVRHKWDDKVDPVGSDVPWQQSMEYSADSPSASDWPDGMTDYPDAAASRSALADMNKGGWTDWVFKVKFDARGSKQGGTGYIDAWKRADNGPWVKVLHITPKVTTRGGMTFDHGICFNEPPLDGNNGGFDFQAGFYMEKDQVWDLRANRVIYLDNAKVGNSAATFADMAPDGSSPGGSTSTADSKPLPPTDLQVN